MSFIGNIFGKFTEDNDLKEKIEKLTSEFHNYYGGEDYHNAVETFEEIKELDSSLRYFQSFELMFVGNAFFQCGNIEQAARTYITGFHLENQRKTSLGGLNLLAYNVAYANHCLGNFEPAVVFCRLALQLHEELKLPIDEDFIWLWGELERESIDVGIDIGKIGDKIVYWKGLNCYVINGKGYNSLFLIIS